MELDKPEINQTHCHSNSYDFDKIKTVSTLGDKEIETLVRDETQTQVLKPTLPYSKIIDSESIISIDSTIEKLDASASTNNEQTETPLEISPATEIENASENETELAETKITCTEYNPVNSSEYNASTTSDKPENKQISETTESSNIKLPQIDIIHSESLSGQNETPSGTLMQPIETEIEMPQVKMSYGEFNSPNDNVFSVSTENILECEMRLPKIQTVYSEFNPVLEPTGTTETQTNISIVPSDISVFCDLKPDVVSNNNAVLMSINKETACDKVEATPDATTKLNVTEKDAWFQVAIKKEIVDSDNDTVMLDLPKIKTDIKAETKIKSEVLDIKDEVAKRNFECTKCQQTFYLECYYRSHMIRHNRTTKFFECDECSFKCRKYKRLVAHIRNHTGEKKIVCKICHDYYYFFDVVEHMRRCPKPKRYNCDECEYATGMKFYYERHMRLHTGERLKCTRCESYFLDNVARKKHYKSHIKEKPYECHICYRRFKQKGARERHILAYCDRKCPKCEYISIYCTDFYDHVKEVHPFTKLKLQLQRMYRAYEKQLSQQEKLLLPHELNETNDSCLSKPVKYEAAPASLPSVSEMEFIKYEVEQNNKYNKVDQNLVSEMEQNVHCETQLNINESFDSKIKRNTDYELMQSVKYELIQGTAESYGQSITDYDYGVTQNVDTDYELMSDIKWGLTDGTENNESSIDNEMEENIDYELIQNVKCELTESTENYTLLCL